jgi:hypothetical protein
MAGSAKARGGGRDRAQAQVCSILPVKEPEFCRCRLCHEYFYADTIAQAPGDVAVEHEFFDLEVGEARELLLVGALEADAHIQVGKGGELAGVGRVVAP